MRWLGIFSHLALHLPHRWSTFHFINSAAAQRSLLTCSTAPQPRSPAPPHQAEMIRAPFIMQPPGCRGRALGKVPNLPRPGQSGGRGANCGARALRGRGAAEAQRDGDSRPRSVAPARQLCPRLGPRIKASVACRMSASTCSAAWPLRRWRWSDAAKGVITREKVGTAFHS